MDEYKDNYIDSDDRFAEEIGFWDENLDFNFEEIYLMDEEELNLTKSKDESLLNRDVFQLCSKDFQFDDSLPLAASNGDLETVSSYINQGVDINTGNEFGNTALHLASYFQHNEIVKFLLKNGADISVRGNLLQSGQTPMHGAALAGNDIAVEILQKHDANLDEVDQFGDTALHVATRKGHLKVVKFLTSQSANVNLLNKIGHSPFLIAIQRNYQEICEILLKISDIHILDLLGNSALHFCKSQTLLSALVAKEMNINSQNNKGITPLLHAISSNHCEKVKVLIKYGADVNLSDYSNTAPLHKAAVSQNSDLVELLIKSGAILDVRDDDGITPFQYAAIETNIEILQLLWKYGSNINSQSDLGYTALYHICWNLALEGTEPLLELLKLGCDPKIPDYAGVSPLHVAVLMAPDECVEVLIDGGAEINKQDTFGMTPLMYSIERPDIVQLLLNKGAETGQLDNGHFTALHHSILHSSMESVKILLNHDSKLLTVLSKEKATPLHLAAMEGSTEILDVLLSFGPDLNVLDKHSCSPLHYAAYKGCPETALKLIKEGCDITKMDAKDQTPCQYALSMGNKHFCKVTEEATKTGSFFVTESMPNLENIFIKNAENHETEPKDKVIAIDKVTEMLATTDSKFEVKSMNLNSKYLTNVLTAPGIGAVSVKNGEAAEISNAIHIIVNQISTKLGEYENIFENEAVFTGSATENTKVGFPDEFDVMFVLKCFSNICVPGERINQIFVPLEAKNPENLPTNTKMFFGNGILLRSKLFRHIHMLLFKITTSPEFQWPQNIYPKLWRGGHSSDSEVTCIHNFIWKGREYKNLTISVDMVPAISILQWPQDAETILLTEEIKLLGFHVVAKPLETSKEDSLYYAGSYAAKQNLWRISFTMAEQKILQSQSESALDSYRLTKALRDQEICPYLQMSHPHSKRNATFSPAAVIPTYFLKMTFLHVMQTFQRNLEATDEQTTEEILIETFKKLEQFFEEDFLPFAFLPQYNLIDSKFFHSFKTEKIPTIICKMLRTIATHS